MGELHELVDEVFDPECALAPTYAVVVVQAGEVVYERYGGDLPSFDGPPTPIEAGTPLLSWSMAKSMLHAAVGILVGDGRLRTDDPAPVPAWQEDERAAITIEHLLSMRDGLDFLEDYVDAGTSNAIDMLFGAGREDLAGKTWPATAPPARLRHFRGRASTTRAAPAASSRGS